MNKKLILNLINKGESEAVEFKASFDQAAIETIVAFANTKGGHVIIGVTDAGKINGVQLGKETIQQWINHIKANTSPSLIPDATVHAIDHKTLVVFVVEEFPVKPVSCHGKYLKRIKNANHRMTTRDISDLHLRSYQTSWDYYVDPRHGLDDISLKKVNKFIELSNTVRSNPITDTPITVLKKFELIKGTSITNACYLLFAAKDALLATIELGRFSGETMIQDGTTIRADLFGEVDAVLLFIRKHLNKSYIITGDKQRQERWDYPLDALREIVINMIVHRDYMDSNDSVIKIFSDRIEFFNPGCLAEGLSIKQLLHGNYISAIRNKQIASIFKEAGIIEKYGSGIKRIMEAFRLYNMPEPLFEEIQNGFRVTIFKTTQKTTQKISTRERIHEALKLNPKITRDELAVMLGRSANTIKEHLSRLKSEDRVERIGSDRDGYW